MAGRGRPDTIQVNGRTNAAFHHFLFPSRRHWFWSFQGWKSTVLCVPTGRQNPSDKPAFHWERTSLTVSKGCLFIESYAPHKQRPPEAVLAPPWAYPANPTVLTLSCFLAHAAASAWYNASQTNTARMSPAMWNLPQLSPQSVGLSFSKPTVVSYFSSDYPAIVRLHLALPGTP